MKDKLLKIINHFGLRNQILKYHEETGELLEQLFLYNNDNTIKNKEEIMTEIADNFVLLMQFIEYFGIDKEDLKKEIKFKVERTISKYDIEK